VQLQNQITESLSRIPTRGHWDGSVDLSEDHISQAVAAEHQENLKIHRWMLFYSPHEDLTHTVAGALAQIDGVSVIPWAENVLGDVTEVFSHLKASIDAYKNR
jgi:hypothetical protein